MFGTLRTVQYSVTVQQTNTLNMIRKAVVQSYSSCVQQVYREGSVSTLRTSLLPQAQQCSAQLFTFTFVIAALLILEPASAGATTEERTSSHLFQNLI